MAHTRQSRPDPGLGFQGKVIKRVKLFPPRSAAEGPRKALRGGIPKVIFKIFSRKPAQKVDAWLLDPPPFPKAMPGMPPRKAFYCFFFLNPKLRVE